MGGVPKIMFGICPRCGNRGGDAPASSLTPADSQSNIDPIGNGYVLEYYRGEKICELCKKELIADEQSLIDVEKQDEAEEFRASAGFVKNIT